MLGLGLPMPHSFLELPYLPRELLRHLSPGIHVFSATGLHYSSSSSCCLPSQTPFILDNAVFLLQRRHVELPRAALIRVPRVDKMLCDCDVFR